MREETKAKLKLYGKRIGMLYMGLLLGVGLLALDNWGWIDPMREMNQYVTHIEELKARELVDTGMVNHCLSLRDSDGWNVEARTCMLGLEDELQTAFGKTLAAGYVGEAGASAEDLAAFLDAALLALELERMQPWNKLQDEAVQACKETITPCFMRDLVSNFDYYDRTINLLQQQLDRMSVRDL
jgi:hypothetical protein